MFRLIPSNPNPNLSLNRRWCVHVVEWLVWMTRNLKVVSWNPDLTTVLCLWERRFTPVAPVDSVLVTAMANPRAMD